MPSYAEKLNAAWTTSGSLLCVGLDPSPQLTATEVADRFCKVVDATSDLVCAYKPNVAFFEALDPEAGYAALKKVLASVPEHVVTICDAKRGDVPHTARAYATAIFDKLGFDACTVNPYLGQDATAPFLDRPDRGAFILCRTSNPGAGALQDLDTGGRPLYESVALAAKSWDRHHNTGLVVGATYPGEMRRIRELWRDAPFLVPGVGAQSGDVAASVRAGMRDDTLGLVVSASRSIAEADNPRRAAAELRDTINRARE